jgi:secretion/DNA translocation related TadE-like protein
MPMAAIATLRRVGRGERGRAPCERGAASVLAIAITGAVVALTGLVVPFAAAAVASQRSENAADAAALAAADALSGAVPGSPCTVAAAVAERNGAALVSCEIAGPAASVTVAITALGFGFSTAARAGPPGWTE